MFPTARIRTERGYIRLMAPQGRTPRTLEVSVVVASHGRPDRLRTLLDALASQPLPRDKWEVVVVHTYPPEVASEVLGGHELHASGTLRARHVDVGQARPSIQRNVGWR